MELETGFCHLYGCFELEGPQRRAISEGMLVIGDRPMLAKGLDSRGTMTPVRALAERSRDRPEL